MMFDLRTPAQFDRNLFEKQYWLYSPYGVEEIEENMPEEMLTLCGPSMMMQVYGNADHAGELLTQRSRTDF